MKRIMLYRGDSATLEFTVKDLAGNVLDLTDWRVYFSMKIGEAIVSKECEVFNPLEGKARVILEPSDTDFIGTGLAELEGRKNGEVKTFGQFLIMFLEDVKE